MIYQGNAITVERIDGNIAELVFDLQGEPVNKLTFDALHELEEAIARVQADDSLEGLLITSGKDAFIVGADITRFHEAFSKPEEDLVELNMSVHRIFNSLEDLPLPTVTALNGLALGGGCELALSTDYRVLARGARIGLPEVKLGIFPGWGGTVRLPRLIGADNAVEWICTGNDKSAAEALQQGVADAVVVPEQLRAAAVDLLQQCSKGILDYRARRNDKTSALKLSEIEAVMCFESAKGYVAAKAGPHYPAPIAAIKVMQKTAGMTRDPAQQAEAKAFAKVARTPVAESLVGIFLNDQLLKKKAAQYAKQTEPVHQAAVLGAGIMGGGIAYQSAYKGTPILMKDIKEKALQQGLKEAKKLLLKRVERGRMTADQMADALNGIRPAMSYGDFAGVDMVVEAVVENPKIKQQVLAEVEDQVSAETVLASNTSTISITSLAGALKRPENFCGMHFFNPVHRMPLVEVIRGEQSGEQAIARTVAYAKAMGKTPIVVNDCPGFLVNRILFPYFGGFLGLLEQGVDFQRIDRVMERFGWPMGPAYLLDVVGMDTALHANEVLAAGYPDRMQCQEPSALDVMNDNQRLGQKTGSGFYRYETDRKGRPQKQVDESTYALLKPLQQESVNVSDEDIIARMMVPLCIETVRCLEDGIVESAAEADMGLVLGIGFPPFRGGALRYIDTVGIEAFCRLADQYAELGPLYHPTEGMRSRAKSGERFFT